MWNQHTFTINKRPRDDSSDDEMLFQTVLDQWKLPQYADILQAEGWDDPDVWTELDENTLISMGFKSGHRAKFIKNVRQHYGSNTTKQSDDVDTEELENEAKEKSDPLTKLPFISSMKKQLLTICNENNKYVTAALISAEMHNMKYLYYKGHDFAHSVIQSVGYILKQETVHSGIEAFRYYEGSDAFGLIIINKDKENILSIANNIIANINSSTKTNMSMGIAMRRYKETKDIWFQRAENALKKAKQNGKSQIVFENDMIFIYKNKNKITPQNKYPFTFGGNVESSFGVKKIKKWTTKDLCDWVKGIGLSDQWQAIMVETILCTGCIGQDWLAIRSGKDLADVFDIQQPMLANRVFREFKKVKEDRVKLMAQRAAESVTYVSPMHDLQLFGQNEYWK